MTTLKIILGLIIIIASFAFLIKNHDKSLMDKMMDKTNTNKNKIEEKKEPESSASKNEETGSN